MKNKYRKYLQIYDKPDNIIIENEKALFIGEHLESDSIAMHIITTNKRLKTITEFDIENVLKEFSKTHKFVLAAIKPDNKTTIGLAFNTGFKWLTYGDDTHHIYGREL